MKKLTGILAFLLISAMLLSLSACMDGGNGDTSTENSTEITTSASDVTTTEPEEETTAAPEGLYAMSAMELLGNANKVMLNSESYTKNIDFKIDMGELGSTKKVVVAKVKGEDMIAEATTDGTLSSFYLRRGESLLIMDNAFGITGYYFVDKITESQLEDIFPYTELGSGILDIYRTENFKKGEVVSSKDGFTATFELSEKGKNLIIGDIEEGSGITYDIKNQSIVANLDESGMLFSLTIDIEMSMTMSGVTLDFTAELDFEVSDISGEVALEEPADVNFIRFEEYEKFYDYLIRATNFQVLYTMYYDTFFQNDCTLELTNLKDNSTRKIKQRTVGRYKVGEGIEFECVEEENGKKSIENYYYRTGSSVVYFDDGSGNYTVSDKMTPDYIGESFRLTLFSTYAGAYDSEGYVKFEKRAFNHVYSLQLLEDYSKDKLARVLTLAGIELPEDAKIEFTRAENLLAGRDSYEVFEGSDMYIEAKVSFGDQSYQVKISDIMFFSYEVGSLAKLPEGLQ